MEVKLKSRVSFTRKQGYVHRDELVFTIDYKHLEPSANFIFIVETEIIVFDCQTLDQHQLHAKVLEMHTALQQFKKNAEAWGYSKEQMYTLHENCIEDMRKMQFPLIDNMYNKHDFASIENISISYFDRYGVEWLVGVESDINGD